MRAPSPNPPDPDDAHAARAEEVRAYLVALRGGAPFLSSADGRLLVKWLDAGIPVPLILTALDRVAARRAAGRQRSRLTLNAARKEVEGLWGMPEARPAPAVAAETTAALRAWADAVAAGGAAVAGLVSAAQQRIAAGGEVEGLLETSRPPVGASTTPSGRPTPTGASPSSRPPDRPSPRCRTR